MNAQRYVLFADMIPLSRVFGQFPKMNLYRINGAAISVYDGQAQPAGIAAFADKRGFRQEPAAQAEVIPPAQAYGLQRPAAQRVQEFFFVTAHGVSFRCRSVTSR